MIAPAHACDKELKTARSTEARVPCSCVRQAYDGNAMHREGLQSVLLRTGACAENQKGLQAPWCGESTFAASGLGGVDTVWASGGQEVAHREKCPSELFHNAQHVNVH